MIIPEASFHRTIEEADRRRRPGFVAAPENSERGYKETGSGTGTADSQDYHDVEDQGQDPQRSQEDNQAKLNRRLEEDAEMKRAIAARVPKKEGRMSKAGASLLRRFKGGSKK